jgi:protein subunit release factor A
MTHDIETRTIEIRPGEGGDDARLFASELAEAYRRAFVGLG